MTRLTYEQLVATPELGSLAILEAALQVATVALAAAWPELHDIYAANEHDEPRAALEILQLARPLLAAVHRYKLVLALAQAKQHDLPF